MKAVAVAKTKFTLYRAAPMDPLIAIIPAVCCVLVPAIMAIAAFVGFGKKTNPANQLVDDSNAEVSQSSGIGEE